VKPLIHAGRRQLGSKLSDGRVGPLRPDRSFLGGPGEGSTRGKMAQIG